MTISSACRDFLHDRCPDCPCRCHTDERALTDTAVYGERHAVGALHTRQLLGHLQGGPARGALTLDQAARVVRVVVDLGWRPSVAELLRDTDPAGADAAPPVAEPSHERRPTRTVQVQEAL